MCDGEAEVDNGQISYDPDEPYGETKQRFEGVTARVSCNAKFGLDGPEAAICISGKWTEDTLGPCLPCRNFMLHKTI